jgi:hypothetical protein
LNIVGEIPSLAQCPLIGDHAGIPVTKDLGQHPGVGTFGDEE